jgi:hypothetical protein
MGAVPPGSDVSPPEMAEEKTPNSLMFRVNSPGTLNNMQGSRAGSNRTHSLHGLFIVPIYKLYNPGVLKTSAPAKFLPESPRYPHNLQTALLKLVMPNLTPVRSPGVTVLPHTATSSDSDPETRGRRRTLRLRHILAAMVIEGVRAGELTVKGLAV